MPISRRTLSPLNALRTFDAAGRRQNFRAAVDELGVSQGVVAQQVRALEDHLGVACSIACREVWPFAKSIANIVIGVVINAPSLRFR